MNYALIKNNIVFNIVWLNPRNAHNFPNAVAVGDIPVAIGDTYENSVFHRNGERVLTAMEKAQNTIAELDAALLELTYQNIIGGV